jgi:hypothetical protein
MFLLENKANHTGSSSVLASIISLYTRKVSLFTAGQFSGLTRQFAGNWFPTNLEAEAKEFSCISLVGLGNVVSGNFAQCE